MLDLLRRVFGSNQPHPLDSVETKLPTVTGNLTTPPPVKPKVLAIIHNPVTPAGVKAQAAYRWNNPDTLMQGYRDDIAAISHGYAQYQIVERIEADEFPIKRDGFRYTPESFDRAWKTRQFHQPDAVDYLTLVKQFKLIERVNDGQIDEVWLMGFPYCGYYESIMGGRGAFWCNAPPPQGTESATRRFVIMGFNYERGVGEMLEDLGHRAESMLSKVYERAHLNLWDRFIRYDKTHPGQAECGNVHFAPNSVKDYDWGNPRPVPSRCDSWLNFPNLDASPRMVDGREWGNGDIREHHRWWMSRFPHVVGESGGISWNWWDYVIDPNRVKA